MKPASRKVASLACALFLLPGMIIDAAAASASLKLIPTENADGTFGLFVSMPGAASAKQTAPLCVSFWNGEEDAAPTALQGGYALLRDTGGEWLGTGALKTPEGVALEFTDHWTIEKNTLRLRREVRVKGNAPGGFTSVAALQLVGAKPWPQMEWFAPGMIYGNFDHLRDNSIGAGNYYKLGNYSVWIREDRMPAPLLATRLPGGGTFAVLNSAPDGATTMEEGQSFSLDPMVDARFRFGAIFAEERGETLSLGFAMPGSEGSLSYGAKTNIGPGTAHRWRYRFNPTQDQFAQHYEVSFRFDRADDMSAFISRSWRWAWQTLKPQTNPQDLKLLRRCLIDVLRQNTVENLNKKLTGVRCIQWAVPNVKTYRDRVSLGFTGRALGTAEALLIEAAREPDSKRARELRQTAESMIASVLRIPVSPPEASGFYLDTGAFVPSKGNKNRDVYLRSYCDDMVSLMRAYEREKQQGRVHRKWLEWVVDFADWLLPQEQPGGGFPRSWSAGTGNVSSSSTTSSFNAVPFYALLWRVTQKRAYLDTALRTAEFGWKNWHVRGLFIGGTIDNPDVLDKEAAVVALEGYLDLYDITGERKWLDRARVSADTAETWMYIWDVPMPLDADNKDLHWKQGVPTTGIQLIATGHSLNDAYMAFNVGAYARLWRATGDAHYRDVASILLHNTKAMVELPNRPLGLCGSGWQQEHWCFTLPRGLGRHQGWLPWLPVSHLRGMDALHELSPELYRELANP